MLLTHAERVAFWRLALRDSHVTRRHAANRLREMESELFLTYRDLFRRESKSRTDYEVQCEVRTNEKFCAQLVALERAEAQADTCWAMVEAFEHRKTALTKLWKRPQ